MGCPSLALRGEPADDRARTIVAAMEEAIVKAKVVDRKLEDIGERYEVGEMLGEGRFSQVFAATRGKTQVALKAVDMGTLEED